MSRADLFLLITLVFAVIGSGVAVVHAKYQSRQLFVQLQDLRRDRDKLDMEWGRLQLELGTVGNPALVEKLARSRLDMRMPRPRKTLSLGTRKIFWFWKFIKSRLALGLDWYRPSTVGLSLPIFCSSL